VSLLPSVKYFQFNDFTYLSDHVQIELYLKCSITDETKTKLDEKRWKNIKTYKWTDTSKELLIEALSDESRCVDEAT
jgi:hypothetical protein